MSRALPPSERDQAREDEEEPKPFRGVGLYRLFGTGWAVSIAVVLLVAAVLVVGAIRNDPVRNPPPDEYVSSACAAFASLAGAAMQLDAGVAALQSDDLTAAERARTDGEARIAEANEALRGIPAWAPGERFDELLASLIITIIPGLDAIGAAVDGGGADEDGLADAAHHVRVADGLVDEGRTALAERRYNFSCPGSATSVGSAEPA